LYITYVQKGLLQTRKSWWLGLSFLAGTCFCLYLGLVSCPVTSTLWVVEKSCEFTYCLSVFTCPEKSNDLAADCILSRRWDQCVSLNLISQLIFWTDILLCYCSYLFCDLFLICFFVSLLVTHSQCDCTLSFVNTTL
jgi:hypothetical protein